jgi:hypothetical protein
VNLGPWITQTKNFAGSGATVGYLPSQKLTVAVVTTYGPGAFDDQGNYSEPRVLICHGVTFDIVIRVFQASPSRT